MHEHLCYLSGDWIHYCDLAIPADDIGFRQGVIAVERLRTYRRRPFHVGAHLIRWQHTTSTLSIDRLPEALQIKEIVFSLLARNEHLVRQQGDVGITLFASPGLIGDDSPSPMLAVHLNRLDHPRIRQRCDDGQPLIVTDVQQPSQDCWPRSIKVRARVHYYLADQQARKQSDDGLGVLVDSQGNVTETSIANLAIVQSGQIHSPPAETVLGGITQQVIESIAQQAGINWTKRAITAGDLRQADEVLLMGTDGGIWFANSVDGQPIGSSGVRPKTPNPESSRAESSSMASDIGKPFGRTTKPGPIYAQLKDRFDQATGKA